MSFHPEEITSSGNTSVCAALTLNSLCSPRNILGQGYLRAASWNTEHLQAQVPRNAGGPWDTMLLVQTQIPDITVT